MWFWVILVSLFSMSCGSLKCYDCEPNNNKNCLDPQDNNVSLENCESAAYAEGFFVDSVVFECISLYFEPRVRKDFEEGMYRGCVSKDINDKTDGCDIAIQRMSEFKVANCKNCSSDGCNTENLKKENYITKEKLPLSNNATILISWHIIKIIIFVIYFLLTI